MGEALSDCKRTDALRLFKTSLSVNLLKKPLFEVVVMSISLLTNMPAVSQGLLVGVVYTTTMMPITNIKCWVSLGMPMREALQPEKMYQAYLPTLLRDILYATVRS